MVPQATTRLRIIDVEGGALGAAPAARPVWLRIGHHPLLLARWSWRPGLLLLAAATATVIIAISTDAPRWPFYGLLLGAIVAAFAVGGAWAGWLYLVWGYDALYLSDRRLVEIRGVPQVREERWDVPLDRVQRVEVEQRGPLMRWYRCGDLVVDVAGSGPLRFAMARDAAALREQITARLVESAHARAAGDRDAVRAAVRQLLEPNAPALPASVAAGPDRAMPPPMSERRAPGRRPGRGPARLRFGRQFAGAVWRRHPWVLVRRASGPALVALATLAAPFLLDRLPPGAVVTVPNYLSAAMLLLAGGWCAWVWADWRNDYYVVTPDRLIEVEQLPLGLRQQVGEAALNHVQDIRYRVPSPLAHLLDYGDVAVHTASAATPFVFHGVSRPRELAATIDEHVTAFRLAEEAAQHRELRAEFAQWLAAYQEFLQEAQGRAGGAQTGPSGTPEAHAQLDNPAPGAGAAPE